MKDDTTCVDLTLFDASTMCRTGVLAGRKLCERCKAYFPYAGALCPSCRYVLEHLTVALPIAGLIQKFDTVTRPAADVAGYGCANCNEFGGASTQNEVLR